jgi:hypothetical protein
MLKKKAHNHTYYADNNNTRHYLSFLNIKIQEKNIFDFACIV